MKRSPTAPTRVAALIAALAVLATACSGGGSGPSEEATAGPQAEPDAGSWDTWVLSAPDQIDVPAPPEGAAAAAEATELEELAGQRTPEMEEAVARWAPHTADQPWTELHLQLVAERAKDPVAASRGYALMSVAVYDATVAAWHWKYAYDREPPKSLTALDAPGRTRPIPPSTP